MASVVDEIGGEPVVRALVERFYDLIETAPEGARILDLHFQGHGLAHVRGEQLVGSLLLSRRQDLVEGRAIEPLGVGQPDVVDAGEGDDTITTGSGADQIFGGAGKDTLNGDAGDDYLSGEAGSDTYVFNRGWGSDNIEEIPSPADHNVIRFGDGIRPSGRSRLTGQIVRRSVVSCRLSVL